MRIGLNPQHSARAGNLFVRLLHATLRVRHDGVDHIESFHRSGRYYVLTFWHEHIPLMFFSRFGKPITVMSSMHRDGEISARNMELFGARVVRGSTSRGGPGALKAMLKIARSGSHLAFTPDGPRGPRRIAQIGVVAAAQMSGMPILPVSVILERKKQLRSWDRMGIPYPFSRVLFRYGEPMEVPRKLTKEELEQTRLDVEHRLNALADEGEIHFAELYAASSR